MIGEHGPRFQVPRELPCNTQSSTVWNVKALWGAEVMRFEVSAGCDEVRADLGELMSRGVRPGNRSLRHLARLIRGWAGNNRFSAAAHR